MGRTSFTDLVLVFGLIGAFIGSLIPVERGGEIGALIGCLIAIGIGIFTRHKHDWRNVPLYDER